jgi:hypothetical protein
MISGVLRAASSCQPWKGRAPAQCGTITAMRTILPFVLLAACTSGPTTTKQNAARIFAATTASMTSAQSRAVSAAHGTPALVAPASLTLAFNGACSAGGTVAVNGSYDNSGDGMRAAFDLDTAFTGCKDADGSLDGDVHWTSSRDANNFTGAMTGSLAWTDGQDSATCDIDIHLSVTPVTVSYTGSVCGYDSQLLISI